MKKNTLKYLIMTLILSIPGTCLAKQISILRGNDTLIDKASNIGFGHFATSKQTIIVDRNTVLSRLACSGIPASQITLTGSEKTIIKQKHQLIKGKTLAEEALNFLKNNLPSFVKIKYFDILLFNN